MARKRQLSLVPKTWAMHHFSFGASLLKGAHPKKKRPFRSKLPMHLVMKSSVAVGSKSFLRFNSVIEAHLEILAKRHGVRLFAASNGGNHLHLLIQAPSRESLNAFTRGVTGRIAQLVAGDSVMKGAFWDARPFSRLVSAGRDFRNVCRYLGLNSMESLLGISRGAARAITEQIQEAIDSGWLRKSPELHAAGFV